jgi:hypothetical protein
MTYAEDNEKTTAVQRPRSAARADPQAMFLEPLRRGKDGVPVFDVNWNCDPSAVAALDPKLELR